MITENNGTSRLGRQTTINDAVGTRTFAYNSETLQLESESITGIINKTINRTYETETVKGRNKGFSLGDNYSVTYGYDVRSKNRKVDFH